MILIASLFQVKNKKSYFDLKGCFDHNDHVEICDALRNQLALVTDDEENGCELYPYYCVTDLCNTSSTAQVERGEGIETER